MSNRDDFSGDTVGSLFLLENVVDKLSGEDWIDRKQELGSDCDSEEWFEDEL